MLHYLCDVLPSYVLWDDPSSVMALHEGFLCDASLHDGSQSGNCVESCDENYAESFVKDSLRKMVMDEPYGPLPDGQFYRKMNN